MFTLKLFLPHMCTYDKIPYVKIRAAYDSSNKIMIRMLELFATDCGVYTDSILLRNRKTVPLINTKPSCEIGQLWRRFYLYIFWS